MYKFANELPDDSEIADVVGDAITDFELQISDEPEEVEDDEESEDEAIEDTEDEDSSDEDSDLSDSDIPEDEDESD